MNRADFNPPRGTRLGIFVGVAILHIALVAVLVRAFSPQFAASVVREVTQAFMVPVETPLPAPSPTVATQPGGAAAPPGRKARPRETSAPKSRIALRPTQAPAVAGKGQENASGAREEGEGTGASGQGSGTGAGAGGSGQGGGAASPPVKIAGDINSARDYPRESRDLRVGTEVIIALTVGADGRVKACRVVRPSPDPHAGEITCRLATARFRFRPAQDSLGRPVEAVYGWRQRWFYRGSGVTDRTTAIS